MTGPAEPGEDDARDLRGPEDDPALNPDVLRRRRDIVLSLLALLFVVALSGYGAYRFLRVPAPGRADLIATAQQAVREQLPAGLVFQFSSLAETEVVASDDDHYSVSGRLVAVAPNGFAEYYGFTCYLGRFPANRWRPMKLALQRQ